VHVITYSGTAGEVFTVQIMAVHSAAVADALLAQIKGYAHVVGNPVRTFHW
jgi:hypothetical protein